MEQCGLCGDYRPPLKELAKIFWYFAGVIVLGALLAPPLFWLARGLEQLALQNGWLQILPMGDQVEVKGPLSFLLPVLSADFQKFFNRSMLIMAVVLLIPTVRALRLQGWSDLNLERDPHRWWRLFLGWLVATLCVAAMAGFYIHFDIYRWKTNLPWGALPKLALTAIVVAILEEALFRGAILGLFLRALNRFWALLLTTGIFAIIHFLKPNDDVKVVEVHWHSGFGLLPHAFHQFSDPAMLLAGLTTLLVLGWVLGYLALRTKSLWMSIGFHAGVVFTKMSFAKFTKREEEWLPWIGKELQLGLIPVGVLLLAGLILWQVLRYEERRNPAPPQRW